MAEIMAAPFNGLTVASTFSGCGGSCLGFRWAGFRHVYANEFTTIAQKSYRANFPSTHLDDRDIRQVTADEILKIAGLKKGELDVFEGSPPCQSFSTAGKRASGWGKIEDQGKLREDLFFEYARLLRDLQPRAFVAENVTGLVKGAAKGYFIEIMKVLQECGYRVSCRILNAKWLGVPQDRARVFIVGMRNDLNLEPPYPTPLPYYFSIRDAIPWIDGLEYKTGARGENWSPYNKTFDVDVDVDVVNTIPKTPGAGSEKEGWRVQPKMVIGGKAGFGLGREYSADAPAPTLMKNGIAGVRANQFEVTAPSQTERMLPPAYKKMWETLKPGETHEKRFDLIRSDPNAPAQTIVKQGGGGAGITHPHEPRSFTIPELRRLGGFPDDFQLLGSFSQQWERVGNSVPPSMAYHVAVALRDTLLAARPGQKRKRRP